VAIKIAQLEDTENGGEKLHKLWMNEIRLSGQLKHPFIANTYEAGLIKAGGYIVMEYLSGGTLKPFAQPGQGKPNAHCQCGSFHNTCGFMH
jgi:serine/threonine protein kinase